MALENKLGIKSSAELAREEERISKKKAVELFENGMLEKLEAGKFKPKRTGQWFRPCKKIRREPSGDRAGYCSFACYQ